MFDNIYEHGELYEQAYVVARKQRSVAGVMAEAEHLIRQGKVDPGIAMLLGAIKAEREMKGLKSPGLPDTFETRQEAIERVLRVADRMKEGQIGIRDFGYPKRAGCGCALLFGIGLGLIVGGVSV